MAKGNGALSTHTVKHCGFKDVKLIARRHNIPEMNSLLFIYMKTKQCSHELKVGVLS